MCVLSAFDFVDLSPIPVLRNRSRYIRYFDLFSLSTPATRVFVHPRFTLLSVPCCFRSAVLDPIPPAGFHLRPGSGTVFLVRLVSRSLSTRLSITSVCDPVTLIDFDPVAEGSYTLRDDGCTVWQLYSVPAFTRVRVFASVVTPASSSELDFYLYSNATVLDAWRAD